MNQAKLKELIKDKKVTLPLYLLRMYKEFNINLDEFVLLIYLFDKDGQVFDPTKASTDLNIDMMEVMETISNLTDKGLVSVQTIKNDKDVMEDVYDLNPLFDKIMIHIIEQLNVKEEKELNIHHLIEGEFHRELSPLEHEIIDEWENNNIGKELIKEAVREASLNGVNNLRYIDKILLDWTKKGYREPKDIKKQEERVEHEEIYNCDWLNDDEEI